ncbi:RSP_7527 family protein [Ideonella sp. YS5]|uniref:RSP_7527 family protein n=1 Tax=Ideonella sp. YS5 TaxID=3453714 RepID=UPI003EED10DA
MNPSILTLAERAVLRDQALRRAHELRSQAIVDGWNAVFAALRGLTSWSPVRRPARSHET